MMPLMLAGIGEENTIKKIGGSPEIKRRTGNYGRAGRIRRSSFNPLPLSI